MSEDDALFLDIEKDMIVLGFKYWNKDAFINVPDGKFGMSSDYFGDSQSSWK